MAKKKIEIRITHYGTQRADQFNANPLNPRIHPQHQRDVIRASLQRFGIISPVVVSKRSGYLIDGHERVWQALAEGDDTLVPYVIADVDEDHEAELILTYDKSTMLAEYDPVNLQALMEQVNTDDEVLAKLFAEMKEEYIPIADEPLPDNPPSIDKAGELQVKWNTERGQLWLIPSKHGGEHRLLCGDSITTDKQYFSNSVVFLDPIYGFDVKTLDLKSTPSLKGIIGLAYGYEISEWVCTLGAFNYDFSIELFDGIIFANKPMLRHFTLAVWDYAGIYNKKYHYTCDNKTSVQRFSLRGYTSRSEIDFKYIKSADLIRFAIGTNSDDGDTISDPFGGSGTTMVACEQLGRLCRMIEIEPKYVAVILERMATLGLEPRLA